MVRLFLGMSAIPPLGGYHMDRQTIDTSELLSTCFDTEKFLGVDRAAKRRSIGVQITERGIRLFCDWR